MQLVQSALGFILGFAAAMALLALCAPFLWRRALFLAGKIVRSELPLSLKEVEADRDFLRARQAVALCEAKEALARERAAGHSGRLALSAAREKLAQTDALARQCREQAAELERAGREIAALKEQNSALKQQAEAGLALKQADLAQFRAQIKQIAAETAGFIAAREGEHSAVLQLAGAEQDAEAGQKPKGRKAEKQGESLAAAICRRAALVRQAAEKTRAARSAHKPKSARAAEAKHSALPARKSGAQAEKRASD